MTKRHWVFLAAIVVTLAFGASVDGGMESLPQRLSNHEFWTIVDGLSEGGGSFVSDNIISNEVEFQRVIPEVQRTVPLGVYLGVGPEQNFTYITAFQPSMAFIVDIRRGNLLLHLTYKALIELSDTRVEFLSRLFARPPPSGLERDARAGVLFEAFGAVPASQVLAQRTLQEVLDHLQRAHGFPLNDDDRRGITEVYRSLYTGGPRMRGDFGGGRWIPSYAELMAQTDLRGRSHSFMDTEVNFRTLKKYEGNNLIVPLVGDFAGQKAIRAVGQYVHDHHATVSIFYTSNVEDYLFRGESWPHFIANVSTLPTTEHSVFIRAFFTHGDAGLRSLLDPIHECLAAVKRGDVRAYAELIARSRTPKP
jgi:hypothetical protein